MESIERLLQSIEDRLKNLLAWSEPSSAQEEEIMKALDEVWAMRSMIKDA